MKIYKITYNINKDDVLASKLSKEIFDTVSGSMGNNTYKDIVVDDVCKLQLNTFNNIQGQQLRYDTFDIRSNFDFSQSNIYPPEIHVKLYFSSHFSNKNFNSLNNVILDAIKHELGHYYQYKNGKDSFEDISQEKSDGDILVDCINTRNYLLSNNELVPYIKGLVLQYKKSLSQKLYNKQNQEKLTFEAILDESLNGILFGNNDTNKNLAMQSKNWVKASEIISEIQKTIIKKAKQLYPFLNK